MVTRLLIAVFLALAVSLGCKEQSTPEKPLKPESQDQKGQDQKGQDQQGQNQQGQEQQAPALEKDEELELLISEFLEEKASWKERMTTWQPDVFYIWEGKRVLPTDGLSPSNASYFEGKMPSENPARAYFLILHLLLNRRHYQLSALIAEMPEGKEVAWEFCISWGWELMKANDYAEAKRLFEIIARAEIALNQKEEARFGALLARVMVCPDAPLGDDDVALFAGRWTYCMERKTIEFFRSTSPVYPYAKVASEVLFSKATAHLMVADMIFLAGGSSGQRLTVWQTGIAFLESNAPDYAQRPDLIPIYATLSRRFQKAIAWGNIVEGEYKEAKKIFESVQTLDAIEKSELRLARAFINFRDDPSLEIIYAQFPDMSWPGWPDYWLGGKKFSFYRIARREERRETIESVCLQNPEIRTCLILLDTFCLLGQKDTARQLLSLIVREYSDNAEVKALCIEEDKEIPRDVYAESQIWEKLD